MAYENTHSILYINSKIPEHFAVFHAVKYVSLKCAVQTDYSVTVLMLIARYQYMLGERGSYLKVKNTNMTDYGNLLFSTVMHIFDTLFGVITLMGLYNISNVTENEFSQANKKWQWLCCIARLFRPPRLKMYILRFVTCTDSRH